VDVAGAYAVQLVVNDGTVDSEPSTTTVIGENVPIPVDSDSDGIPDSVENGAPNNGDGNNDGTVDENQDNVVTLLSPVSNKYVTVAADDTCVLSDVSIASASSHASQDTAFDYKSGFVNFTATGCNQGVANVKLYYHGVTPENVIARKYNPTTNTYKTIAGASIAAASTPLSGTVVSYAVVDNSELDIDPADGVIVDPVGLANVPGVPNTGLERRAPVLPVTTMFAAFALQ